MPIVQVQIIQTVAVIKEWFISLLEVSYAIYDV